MKQHTSRSIVLAGLSTVIGLSLTPTVGQAQTHIGNGQALNVQVNVLAPVAHLEAVSTVAGPQPAAGANFSVGPEARVSNLMILDVNLLNPAPVFGSDTFVDVNASALTASSNGGGGVVTSVAQIGALGSPSINASIGLSAPLLNLSNFLTVKAVRTTTFANAQGLRTSSTLIEGLTIRDTSQISGFAKVGNTVFSNINLSFTDSDSPFLIGVSGVANITLHEKITNGDGSRTTNGIHIGVLNSSALGAAANVDVKLASSRAGIVGGAVAPEPGSGLLSLLGAGFGAMGVLRRRKQSA